MKKCSNLAHMVCLAVLAFPGLAAAAHDEAGVSSTEAASRSLLDERSVSLLDVRAESFDLSADTSVTAGDGTSRFARSTWSELADARRAPLAANSSRVVDSDDEAPGSWTHRASASGDAGGTAADGLLSRAASEANAGAAWQVASLEQGAWNHPASADWWGTGRQGYDSWGDGDGDDDDFHRHHHHHHHHGGCDYDDQSQCSPAPVPEPASYAMFLLSLGVTGWAARRQLLNGRS